MESPLSTRRSSGPKTQDVKPVITSKKWLIVVFFSTALLMGMYEVIKESIFEGSLTPWTSHWITIIITSILATLSAFIMRLSVYSTYLKEKEVSEKYHELMQKDPLSHLFNRRGFLNTAIPIHSHAIRHQHSCSLLMLDIDDFKKINDEYGHQTGDNVITFIANILKSEARTEDLICRWGGEEFIIFSTEICESESFKFAERIRLKIEDKSCFALGLKVTTSIGVYNSTLSESMESLINIADKALYQAKKSEKNCTQLYKSEYTKIFNPEN